MFKDKKVLVIDDQIFIFNLMKKSLISIGFEHIDYASTGIEALEMLEKQTYDLITCDITMPQINGIETAKRIFEKYPDQKFIMITAIGQKYAIEQAIKVGVKFYLLKPFSQTQLVDRINSVFSDKIDE